MMTFNTSAFASEFALAPRVVSYDVGRSQVGSPLRIIGQNPLRICQIQQCNVFIFGQAKGWLLKIPRSFLLDPQRKLEHDHWLLQALYPCLVLTYASRARTPENNIWHTSMPLKERDTDRGGASTPYTTTTVLTYLVSHTTLVILTTSPQKTTLGFEIYIYIANSKGDHRFVRYHFLLPSPRMCIVMLVKML